MRPSRRNNGGEIALERPAGGPLQDGVADWRKRTIPLPGECFLAVGSRSELGMDKEDRPDDYVGTLLRVRVVLPDQRPLGTVNRGLSLRACVEGALRSRPHVCHRRDCSVCDGVPHPEAFSPGLRSRGIIYTGGDCGG